MQTCDKADRCALYVFTDVHSMHMQMCDKANRCALYYTHANVR